jgi:glutamate N-acetyltransferase/amino-acid N-acetyltransferase
MKFQPAVFAGMAEVHTEAVAPGSYIPASPILLPDGPWKQIPGGVTAAAGFQAAGMYGGLRAAGRKPDLALVVCDTDAVSAGTFTKNVMAAAPVMYCKQVLAEAPTVCLINSLSVPLMKEAVTYLYL